MGMTHPDDGGPLCPVVGGGPALGNVVQKGLPHATPTSRSVLGWAWPSQQVPLEHLLCGRCCLGAGYIAVNKTGNYPCPWGVYLSVEKKDNTKVKYRLSQEIRNSWEKNKGEQGTGSIWSGN